MQKNNNSIYSEITKDSIINDIRMSLSSTPNNDDVFVIVEGQDDIKFLRNYVANNVEIKESFSGCKGVNEIIEELEEILPTKNTRFLGIRDRDYETLLDNERMFYYDYNSLEILLINSDEVLTKIYNEYYNGDKTKFEIREHILKQLKVMSVIRKLNSENKWGLRLNGVSIDKAYDGNSDTLSIENIISQINGMNNNFFEDDEKSKLVEQGLEEMNSISSLLMSTRGHDAVHLFKCICNSKKLTAKSKEVNADDIGSSMRCSYPIMELKETDLYKEIKFYENKNDIKIFNI